MVNMPLAPQLITEVSPGEDLDDLSEFIGPELATLVSATQDKSITILQNPDMNTWYSDMSGHVNYESSDFGKVLGEYAANDNQHNPNNIGAHGGIPNQTFRKVIIARKIGGGGAGGVAGGGPQLPMVRTEDNNNNNNSSSDMIRNDFVTGNLESGSKALLLQHRDNRSDTSVPGPSVVSSKTASGEGVTLTVVRGDPVSGRGQHCILTPYSSFYKIYFETS